MRLILVLCAVALLSGSCGGTSDDTDLVQSAVDAGGVVNFAARTYHLQRTIVIRNSNTVIQGEGPKTMFEFASREPKTACGNDRVFTTPCEIINQPPRRIASAISIGDQSFTVTTASDVSDLQPGDWLIVSENDSIIGNIITIDWVQVQSVSDLVVNVRAPFRTAFSVNRHWDPGRSGLGFRRVIKLVENVEFRNFSIFVPDAGTGTSAACISVFAALHTTIDHIDADSFDKQTLYSYISKDLTITNSSAIGHNQLSEFAATVDLNLRGNRFRKEESAGMGLDLGTAFFDVSDNDLDLSRNIGTYLLYGIHDGTFRDNRIAYVHSDSNAFGMLIWGDENVTIFGNYLVGGDGTQSTGISVRSAQGEVELPSSNITLSGNVFGSGWVFDYEAGTQ